MLQEPKKLDADTEDTYECALELEKLFKTANIAPVMTMVLYEFLSDVIDNKIEIGPSMYEYLQELFEDKINISFLTDATDAQIHLRSKAYLILALELLCHGNLVNGLRLPLKSFLSEEQSKFSVILKTSNFNLTSRGINFIKKVDEIKTNRILGESLITRLSNVTFECIEYILKRYKKKSQVADDVIVIDSIQA